MSVIIERDLDIDVVQAAMTRITNIFKNRIPVYFGFSGGKDSLVLAHMVETLIIQGRIDPRLLRVHFIDEEAIFPCVERTVMAWRRRFLDLGASFTWFCVEVKHHSCLNMLANDESFVCWDSTARDLWVRDMPACAVTTHPSLLPRAYWPQYLWRKTYQDFLANIRDGVHMLGVRAAESVQRRSFLGRMSPSGLTVGSGCITPVYDWKDSDVWLYLADHHVDIPDAYRHMFAIGVPRRNMRISQFFSIDTVPSLSRVAEYYPGLMERILRREPHAYLVALYWDSEMFRRRTATRRAIEKETAQDWKAMTLAILRQPPEFLKRSHQAIKTLHDYQQIVMKFSPMMAEKHWKAAYEAITTGDPKSRARRALAISIIRDATAPRPRPQRPAGAPRDAETERLQPERGATA